MPIEVEVDGLPDLLEFDDGTPDDVIQRVVKEQVARKNFYSDVASEQERARGSILTKAASAELSAIEAVEPVLGRISLGGISRMAGAIAKDVLSPGIPGIPTPRATAAELMGQETPADIQAGIQESVVKQGLVAAAETVPVVGAAMLTAPVLAPGMIGAAASGALALGASAAEESGGEVYPTFKGTVIGAALPGLGAVGRGAAARVTGALVNQGATALSNPVVQRAIEAGAAQVPIQAVMLGDLMASPEYRQASPDDRDRMLAVHAISNIPYGIPDAVQAFRGGAPLANEFETPAVWEARRLAGDKPLTAQAIIDAETLLKTADPNRTDPLSIVPTEEQPSAPITGISDAVQEQGTDASLLRQKRSALGLRGVAEETAPQENVGQEQPAQAAGRLTPEEQVLAQEELGEAIGPVREYEMSLIPGGRQFAQAISQAIAIGRRRRAAGAAQAPVVQSPSGAPQQQQQPATATQAKPPSRPLKTIDDSYRVFEPKPTRLPSVGKVARRGVEAVREGFGSKYRSIGELQEGVERQERIPRFRRRLADYFETLKGSSGQADLDVMRFDEAIEPSLRGIEPRDFNVYLKAQRTIDRLTNDPNVKQVADWTIADEQNVLRQLEAKLGPDGWQRIQRAGQIYNDFTDIALKSQVASGRMSQDTYDRIKNENDFYAPFVVMDKLVEIEARPAGSGRQVDTQAELTKAITGIHDNDFRLADMMQAARRQISIARILSEKNLRMRALAEFASIDTQGTFIRQLGPTEDPARGKGSVVAMQDGNPVHYEVDLRVADAIKMHNAPVAGLWSKSLGLMGGLSRFGITTGNIVFQGVNLGLADQPRMALMSRVGLRNPMDIWRYPMDFFHAAFASAAGNRIIPGVAAPKIYRDFLESGAAGATLQSQLTPDALQYRAPGSVTRRLNTARTVLETPVRFAQAIEEISKVMGIKRAMRITGTTSGEELAKRAPEMITEVRRFAGSPDFGRSGKWTDAARLNLLFMFSNARIQGTAADVSRLLGADGAKTTAATWAKVGTATGVLTSLAWMFSHRDEYVEDYEKVSDQEKKNYFMIPKDSFIVNDQGQRVRDWIRIPKRESIKLISNTIEAGLEWWNKKDPEGLKDFGVGMLEDLAPVNIQGRNLEERMESVISSSNPLIKAPVELGTGRNTYLHRDIVTDPRQKVGDPELQFNKGTPEAFKRLAVLFPDWDTIEFLRSPLRLENLTKNLTGSLFTQFLPAKEVEGRTGIAANRFLKRFQGSGYVDNPEFREDFERFRRDQANESLNRERAAEAILKKNNYDRKASVGEARSTKDKALRDRVEEMARAREAGVTREDRQMLQLAPRQRAQMIMEQVADMEKGEAMKYERVLRQRKVLSDATLRELRRMKSAITNK